jgi:hypothetical protein
LVERAVASGQCRLIPARPPLHEADKLRLGGRGADSCDRSVEAAGALA